MKCCVTQGFNSAFHILWMDCLGLYLFIVIHRRCCCCFCFTPKLPVRHNQIATNCVCSLNSRVHTGSCSYPIGLYLFMELTLWQKICWAIIVKKGQIDSVSNVFCWMIYEQIRVSWHKNKPTNGIARTWSPAAFFFFYPNKLNSVQCLFYSKASKDNISRVENELYLFVLLRM